MAATATAAVALLPLAAPRAAAGALLVLTAEGDVGSSAVREKAADIGGEGRREISHVDHVITVSRGSRFFGILGRVNAGAWSGGPTRSNGRDVELGQAGPNSDRKVS